MLLSFESLCAVLYSCITEKKSLTVSSCPLAVLKSARCTCRLELPPEQAGAAAKGCGCIGHPECGLVLLFWGWDGSPACDLLSPICAVGSESKASHMLEMSFWFDYFLCLWLMVNYEGELVLQGRSQNSLRLFPHGHAQIPPHWKKIPPSFLFLPGEVRNQSLKMTLALKTSNSLL